MYSSCQGPIPIQNRLCNMTSSRISLIGNWIRIHGSHYSETSNNGLSERRTTSIQRTNSMPPIALPIEIVYLEPPSSRHLSTTDSQRAPKGQQSVQNNLQKRTETKTASINHKNTIKFLTFVTQIVCPLLCFVDFCPLQSVFDRDLLIQPFL